MKKKNTTNQKQHKQINEQYRPRGSQIQPRQQPPTRQPPKQQSPKQQPSGGEKEKKK